MTLREAIIEWHNGKRKNAISDFADALGVKANRVTLWVTARTWPDEDLQPKVCSVLKVSLKDLAAMKTRMSASMVRDSPHDYADSLRDQVRELKSTVERLVADVEELKGARRSLRK